MVRQRVRIRFSKQGNLRFLGHHDLARLMERLFRRANVRLATSQGYHPKPRMAFPSALALGMEGLNEVMEVELACSLSADDLLAHLNEHAEPGLAFRSACVMPPQTRKAQLRNATYRIAVPADRRAAVESKVRALLAATTYPVVRSNRKGTTVDARPLVESLWLDDAGLGMRLGFRPQGSVGPRDLLAVLGLSDLESEGYVLARTDVELQP